MLVSGPLVGKGQRIGLLGGSFDPPHMGHVHVSDRALRRTGLDQVWWLVSPGNPLKANGPADIDRRVAACRALIRNPKVAVSDIERYLPNAYTANTLRYLLKRFPGVRFVWLMGADNLASFHHWEDWRWIMENVPIGIIARPGQQLKAGLSPAARLYHQRRLPLEQAGLLGRTKEARWVLLPGPMSEASSTEIRNSGGWR